MQTGDPKLPWWVELLFVQIGLPDIWLRSLLKARKSTNSLIKNNRKAFGYSILALSSIYFINPIVRQAQINNQCIQSSQTYIADQLGLNSKSNKNEILSWSTRFCNGGKIP